MNGLHTRRIEEGQMTHAILVGIAVYASQKAVDLLVRSPDGSANERVRQVRERVWECRQRIREQISDRAWFIMTDVIADNAWIAAALLTYLAGGRAFESVEMGINSVAALAGFCSLAWLVRFAAVKMLPSTGRFIGGRNA
jgi:hypothetical protein